MVIWLFEIFPFFLNAIQLTGYQNICLNNAAIPESENKSSKKKSHLNSVFIFPQKTSSVKKCASGVAFWLQHYSTTPHEQM